MRPEIIKEKISGLKELVSTYEDVGREDCENCAHVRTMITLLEDELERTRQFHEKEKATADALQETGTGPLDMGGDSGELSSSSETVLSARLP